MTYFWKNITGGLMIKAVLFDLDNTLINFLKMKRMCVESVVDAMIEAGLKMEREKAIDSMYKLYEKYDIEYHHVFDEFSK